MILLDFDRNALLKESRDSKWSWASRPVLVRLSIAGVELWGGPRSEIAGCPPEPESMTDDGEIPLGLDLSVLDVALWGRTSLVYAHELGNYVYELGPWGDYGEAILFKMAGPNVLVHSTWIEQTVRVEYTKLLTAWDDFADQVRAFMRQEFPALHAESGWKEWLENKDYLGWATPATLFPFAAKWFKDHESCFERIDAIEN